MQLAIKRCKHFELGGDKKKKVTKLHDARIKFPNGAFFPSVRVKPPRTKQLGPLCVVCEIPKTKINERPTWKLLKVINRSSVGAFFLFFFFFFFGLARKD